MSELPSGTVTFLFTDIEGSTRLLHELGAEAYAEALTEHRRVLRAAFAAHGGVEVDTQGDAFFVAFPTVPGALAAAHDAQAALTPEPVSVRMALHTGTPLLAEEGYVGVDIHRAARIAAAGHGGQVLVSASTAALADGTTLRDLGEHRFKDLAAPERVYQLGEGDFAPLKSLYRTNLPVPATRFLRREDDLAALVEKLRRADVRLLTLSGPGGTGKTRLALQAAAEAAEEFPDGMTWIPLAPLADPTLVLATLAQALGLQQDGERPLEDLLAASLAGQRRLLLLDNAEHLLPAIAADVAKLRDIDGPKLLVTSRERLQLQGETVYAVPSLTRPDAIALFTARAAELGVTVPHSPTLDTLCERLDDLPLALELAAARTPLFTPEQLLERVGQRLDLLKGGRDADPRQQTLRATIQWSHDLLDDAEQTLFRRLSVFAGGCTYEAAEQVCDANAEALQSLIDKSLVRVRHADLAPRYWMLETIREYASDRLARSGELEESQRRHAEFVLGLASELETALGSDPELRDRFAVEQENFRAALAWADEGGHTECQLGLIGRSWPFWWYRGNSEEGLRWVESALAQSEGERSARRAKVLLAGAMFAYRLGELARLKTYADESLRIARTLGESRSTTWPLIFLGIWASEVGNSDEATNLYQEAIAMAREAGDRKLVGIATNNLGVVAMQQEDFVRAAPLFEEALAISRELGTLDEIPLETLNLASCLHHTGRPREAAKAAKEGLAMAREVGNLTSLEYGFFLLAEFACRQGRADVHAARLLGVAETLRNRVGEGLKDDAELLETMVKGLVSALGDEGFAKAFAQGKALSLDEAVEYALSLDS